MTSENSNEPKLIHVRHPIRRVKLTFKPTTPTDEPVTDGPLIPVSHPMQRVKLTFKQAQPASLEAIHPATSEAEKELGKLSSFVGKLNEADSLYNQPGVRIDAERSGVRDGKVVLILTPNDPTDAVATCKRVADYLFAVIRTIPGATVRVFVANQPDQPVYELAS